MKIFWIPVLAILRATYFIYSLSFFFIPLLILYCVAAQINLYFFQYDIPSITSLVKFFIWCTFIIFLILLVVIPFLIYRQHLESLLTVDPNAHANPFQSALTAWLGTLRWYRNLRAGPMVQVGLPSAYLVENPTNYQLTGSDMRDILNKLQPGDILLRAFDGYVDGALIRCASVCAKKGYRRGWFTHVALYVGPLSQVDQEKVPTEFQQDREYFQQGPQMVIHSMAKGVHTEDILTWLRCDYVAVLRMKPDFTVKGKVNIHQAPKKAPSESDTISENLQNGLRNNETIHRESVVDNAKLSALEKIGEPYDFECVVTNKFNRFSCSELIYFCLRSVHDALGLMPRLHALYPLSMLGRLGRCWHGYWHIFGRVTVTPDDFFDLAKADHFDIVWIDQVSERQERSL